jgi:glutathione S-transferase
MDLYFSPLACSMATRIALYEAGHPANFIEVDPKTKKVLLDNSDFYAVNALGLVPVVRTDDGVILTENAAILQHVAEKLAASGIGAREGMERSRLQQWLCFIGTELHKALFTPLLGKTVPAEVKSYTLEKYLSRLDYLDKYLRGREFLLDHFSVADAYLTTVLNWSIATPMIDFSKYPAVKDYLERMKKRPAVAKALAEEFELYKAEMARHKQAA